MLKRSLAASLLTVIILAQLACSNFSSQLRLALIAAPPLIEALPLPPTLRTGLITDFTDMASETATLNDCLKSASGKPAKLTCVATYEGSVETIVNRGHFGQASNPKLQRILALLRAIIASAKIYYGGQPPSGDMAIAGVPRNPTEDDIKKQIEDLKREMEHP